MKENTEKQKKKKSKRTLKKKASLQKLLGIKGFTEYGLRAGENTVLFFKVSPTNISVLSKESIEIKEHHLMMVLSALPDITIFCMDSAERFDDNLRYLKKRAEETQSKKLRELLKKDIQFLDSLQLEMATSRSFLFVKKLYHLSDAQCFAESNRIEKIISEQGFECSRFSKADIKRMLAIYFDASLNGQEISDIDGLKYFNLGGSDEDAV